MKELTHGGAKYTFYWAGSISKPTPKRTGGSGGQESPPEVLRFCDPLQASAFLRGFPLAIVDLCQLLREKAGMDASRFTQQQLIHEIAAALCKRALIVERFTPRPAGISSHGPNQAASQRTVVPRKNSVSDTFAATADASTFAGGHDPKAQTGALLAAAQNGAPLCEECEKARQAMREEANEVGFSNEDGSGE